MAPSSASERTKNKLGVSTAGNRQHRLHASDTIQEATDRVLRVVEDKSNFFDQVEPHALPTFELSEIEQGEFLGRGEFGDVWEVKSIYMEVECPCDTCGIEDTIKPLSRTETSVEIIVADSLEKVKQYREQGTPTATPSSALNKHKRTTSSVSFAKGVKEAKASSESLQLKVGVEQPQLSKQSDGQAKSDTKDSTTVRSPLATTAVPTVGTGGNYIDDSDNSTLSTGEEESVTNLLQTEDIPDGEAMFLRGYMSTNFTRQGIARYAIKRARSDLSPDDLLEAVVDLAVEAKFLAAMRHPNIVRMRGTVGSPGNDGFMIVMDRLRMTLREKMKQWRTEVKGKNPSLLGKMLGQVNNSAIQREQYGDKLLAVYDIARAMRYLHNHMIIYRDLKPENIAVDVRGDMRLFDFGLVKELKAKDLVEPPDGFAATGLTGSRRYMAPEVCSCKNYGLKADVYSFAIVFWEVFSGQEAYAKMSFDKHFDQVVVKGKRPSPKVASAHSKHLSKSLVHLMPDMWNASPSERPTFRNICDRLAGECLTSSTRPPRGMDGIRDSDQSHESYLTDRTRYLLNRSLHSRYALDVGGDSPNDSVRSQHQIIQ